MKSRLNGIGNVEIFLERKALKKFLSIFICIYLYNIIVSGFLTCALYIYYTMANFDWAVRQDMY